MERAVLRFSLNKEKKALAGYLFSVHHKYASCTRKNGVIPREYSAGWLKGVFPMAQDRRDFETIIP